MILIPSCIKLGQLRFSSHDKPQDKLRHRTSNRSGNSTRSIDRSRKKHIQHECNTLGIHNGSHITQTIPSREINHLFKKRFIQTESKRFALIE